MPSLTPWRERKEVEKFRKEVDRLFERFFEWRPSFFRAGEGEWEPVVDLSETSQAIILRAELPGMEADDIDVSITGHSITIKGERKQEKEEQDENFHKIERSYGMFSRTIQLPVEIDPDKVKATYKKGVLTLKMPKVKAETVKKVQIQTN